MAYFVPSYRRRKSFTMNFFLEDPILFWLVWGIFTLAGTIIGWSLRANTSEKEVRSALGRIEQEKNTLARLYTQVKHQHDLREADFRRAVLDLDKLRTIIQLLEDERSTLLPDAPFNAARIASAETAAAQYAQKLAALEVLANGLRTRNNELSDQLAIAQKEIGDWDTLYRGFKATQERLADFEQKSLTLEAERDTLRRELALARTEMEMLQLELQQKGENQAQKPKNSRKGSVAEPQIDDLKSIKGIAPFVQRLSGMGITTFAQISRWDDDTVIAVAKTLDISPGKIYRDDWVGQAQRLTGERR
jgi:predicted flap endonuclease-1-like 5' DNA nuclease